MKKKKIISLIFIFSFLFSSLIPLISLPSFGTNNTNTNPKTSTNYLFKGTPYTFNLDDFYDDADLTKIWNRAKFQTEDFNGTTLEWSGTIDNDTVTPVNNTETQYGDPSNINMINGTSDYADNMKILDGSFTKLISTIPYGNYYESPHQWNDFAFTKGSGGATGELEANDGDYARIDAELTEGSESLLGYVKPADSDITTQWSSSGSPHYAQIDEAKGDMDGDGAYIYASANGKHDKWNFNTLTLPAGHTITKIVVAFYCKDATLTQSVYFTYQTSTGQSGTVDIGSLTYIWKTYTHSGLSLSQSDLNSFWVDVELIYPGGIGGACYIETVYVDIYTTIYGYSCDYAITWTVTDPDLVSINDFYYDYRTTASIDCDLDIYNWDTTNWLELESNTGTSYITDSYALTDPYINGSNYVRIRFQTGVYSSDFDMELDQIALGYWNTSSKGEMNGTISIELAGYNEDLLYLNVSSWHRTNITQTIDFKIWNVDTSTWEFISSSSSTSFTNYTLLTASVSDYINSTGHVLVWYSGYNYSSFELQIDYLFARIFYKLDLVHEKSFDTNGIWRYRWVVFGSIHYTQWVTFEVIDPVPNFHAISESDDPTRWILQGSDISPVVDFTDDISGSNWDLDGVSNRIIIINNILEEDSCVNSGFPNTNYGSSTTVNIQYNDIVKEYVHGLIKYEYIHLDLNYTSNSTLKYFGTSDTDGYAYIYHTSDFDESTVTWNNQPATGTYQTGWTVDTGWHIEGIGAPNEYYKIISPTDMTRFWAFCSKDAGSGKPRIRHYLSKNYQGSGMMYMQTNTTELISLKSTDYTTHYNLSSGDYFQIDFQTSSSSQIDLILLKNGVVNKTVVLSQSGNTNFNRHAVQISVDEFVEFDQLKISSTFEDTDNVKCWDIKTYKYTLTGDTADFRIGSKNDYEIYLTPDIYNLRISDGTHIEDEKWSWQEKINVNITIPATGVRQYVYVPEPPISKIKCRLTLFPVGGGLSLTFTDYHIDVNRSYDGIYKEISLVEPIFYADELTTIYITIKDRFELLIGTFSEPIKPEIDLYIKVYSLQIKNLQTQKTKVDINTTLYEGSLLSGDSIYFMLSENYYQIGYYDTNNVYKQFLIFLDSNQAYELNRSKICFLAYVNQRGEHLFFDDYKTYINDSLIYENIFYRVVGDIIGIEIKDIYGISIKNETYTVVSGDNYIPVVLTQYSLKVMNLQLSFNFINITRDPNYYESSYYWSEWIAPYEVIKFRLFAGYYKINLSNNEAGSSSYYSYTLSGDDMLLIGSNHTIYNVLVNIANVNTTIGNQITNVQIDLTNQNSQINNSIINVDINLGNINSSLGNMLINLDVDVNNIANNVSSLYVFTNNSFINLGNDVNVSFISIENNIISINQSISNLVIGVSNDVYLINGTISTMITQMENKLLLMNISLNTALFDLGTTLSIIGSNITENFILLNNSIYLNSLNINDSRVAIINNLALINNSISNMIAQVYSSVYLINNSIYTAVVDLGTYLSLINNTIDGNLSIVLQMNEFLTELYQMTMFSDLLNWTNIGLNISLLTSQIDVWTFVNNYINQSIEVHLRYQDLIEKLVISADDFRDQWLPSTDVEYNLWSVADEEYLDEWKELDPKNKTVPFGFYEEEVPVFPSFDNTSITITLIILIFIGIISLPTYFVYKYNKRVKKLKVAYARQHTVDKDLIEGISGSRSSRMKKIK